MDDHVEEGADQQAQDTDEDDEDHHVAQPM
jgi:hypothetical protein